MAYIVKSVIIYFKNINISFRSVNFWPQRKQVCFLKQTPDFPRGSRGEQRYWRSVMYHGQDIFCFKNGQETVTIVFIPRESKCIGIIYPINAFGYRIE